MDPPNYPGREREQMMQNDPQRRSRGRAPTGGTPQSEPQGAQPLSEMTVTTPTVCRVTMDHPQARLPIGPSDYVLNSVYDHQRDAWEVVVLVQPNEAEEEAEE